MRFKLLGTVSVVVALAVVALGAAVSHAAPSLQQGVVYLQWPTQINGRIAQGTVLIVHDEAKMDAGEPCTTIYQYDQGKGRGEEITTFACVPVQRKAAEKLTATCARLSTIGSVPVNILTEYQFAGDTEAHGVPSGR